MVLCSVCRDSYDARTRVPMNLPCGHSICKPCLNTGKLHACPMCRALLPLAAARDAKPNYALLEVTDSVDSDSDDWSGCESVDSFTVKIDSLSGQAFKLEVKSTDTIGDLKRLIYERTGVSDQRVIFCGKQLNSNWRPIAEVRIQANSVLHVVTRMRGGGGGGTRCLGPCA